MAKRKKSKKRTQTRRSEQAPVVSSATQTPILPPEALTPAPNVEPVKTAQAPADPRWAYVSSDLKKVGILASACIILELVLWYLFNHTGLGSTVYGWFKI